MAHSWSGNLVTNATWNDLWLNEGFTTYFERRIMEKITDKSYVDMLWELGYQDLQMDFADMGMDGKDTRLKVELNGRNPGDGFTNIPYEKGAVFLRLIEETVGRPRFDVYINNYFTSRAFKPTTTEDCLAFMDEHLFKGDSTLKNKIQVNKWVYEPGLPDNCPRSNPTRFIEVDKSRTSFEGTATANSLKTTSWSTHEWLQFLRKLPHPLSLAKMKDLDDTFKLTDSKNSEIADEWFKLCINSDYEAAYPNMELFLGSVGRQKFLEPLYSELITTEKGKELAKSIFGKSRTNYHPLTALKIEKILK
jgi:hypothetical protein